MKTALFKYNLPEERIAQFPPETRGSTRLMVIERQSGSIRHMKYSDLPQFLSAGDCVVANDTRVEKSRMHFTSATGRNVEVLFLTEFAKNQWEVLIGKGRKLREGMILSHVDDPSVQITLLGRSDDEPIWKVSANQDMKQVFNKVGHVPLPPYIKREDMKDDATRYNTMFARMSGSAAAPTAGLNLTDQTLSQLENNGVMVAYVTLDVGWGTFAPVRVENVEDHKIHTEKIELSEDTAATINKCKENGGKILSIGTTTARVLESAAENGKVKPFHGQTDLFIYPGYNWKVVDALLTNFHAPESSLLMLVSSFMGLELMHEAYKSAIRKEYNFLSYGDSMLII